MSGKIITPPLSYRVKEGKIPKRKGYRADEKVAMTITCLQTPTEGIILTRSVNIWQKSLNNGTFHSTI